jgi:membrane protease YdiL (CAAX protease family)
MLPQIRQSPLLAYFLLAYAISWSFEIPIALSAQGWANIEVPYAIHYLASFGPMLAALAVVALTEGRPGLRRLLGGLRQWRVAPGYWAFSTLGPIALFAIAVLASRIVDGAWPDLRQLGQPDYLPYLGVFGTLALWLVTFGLGEEVGWRGFALPRLQRTRTAASASLILGVVWGLWHLPALFYRDTYMAMGFMALPMLLASVIFASILMTWLFNATRGSLLLVVLFHGVFNLLSVSEAGGDWAAVIMGAGAVAWAVFVMRRYGPEHAGPVPRQSAERLA